MPGLVAFGRRWEVASDDLVVPSIIETFVRLIWFAVTVGVWTYHAHFMDCEDGHILQMYLGGVVCILMLIMGTNTVLIKHSMKGSIMDVSARKHVPKILYIRIFLEAPELAWTVVGSIWVFGSRLKECIPADSSDLATIRVVQGLVIFNWVLFALFLVGVVVVFDPHGHNHSASAERNANLISTDINGRSGTISLEVGFEQRTRVWERRCKFLCCSCCSSGCCSRSQDNSNVNDAFGDVASVLTAVFHDMDLVPSDIAAGLLLLHLRTKRSREAMQRLRRVGSAQVRSGQHQQPVRRPITCEAPRTSVIMEANNVLTSSPTVDATSRAEFSPSALSVPPSAACSPTHVITGTLNQLGSIMEESPLGNQRSHEAYDWMNPSSAYIYMKYAMGTYGWMWHLYGGFWDGLRSLRKELVCCSCCRRRSGSTGDNCCHCNLAALKTMTDLDEKDLLFVSFHNSIYEVPYFVAVDHRTHSIVVAIRGTLSGHDALTDLAAMTDPISVEGLPVGWTAHRGMLQAANFLLRQLDKNNILNRAFSQFPTYHLVVTGHSLGAGAAVLLSVLLKSRYPKIRCFAFSPPGGLLSQAAARFTENFCLSVIVGDDLVPRLSLDTLESLKRQMVLELEMCRHPKYRIFMRGCWEVLFGSSRTQHGSSQAHPLFSTDSPNNNMSYQESFSEVPGRSPPNRCIIDAQQLYLPGRILQVEEREPLDSESFLQEPVYEARWMQREDYHQIIVTPRMLLDHVPDTVTRVLRGLAAQYESSISATEPHET